MNTIEIKGKTYRKASELASELGYTTDYLGQLCRAEKVDAALVGRAWYIDPESLNAHKSTRYRSTKAKTKEAVRSHLARKTGSSPLSVRSSVVHLHPHVYEDDQAELIPRVEEKNVAVREEEEGQPRFEESQDVPRKVPLAVARTSVLKPENKLQVTTTGGTMELKAVVEEAAPVRFQGLVAVRTHEEEEREPIAFESIAREELSHYQYEGPASNVIVERRTVRSRRVEVSLWRVVGGFLISTGCAAAVVLAFLSIESSSYVTLDGTTTDFRVNFKEMSSSLLEAFK